MLHAPLAVAADTGPSDSAVQAVVKDTIEHARSVELKPGQNCPTPAMQRFKVLKRGAMKTSTEIPQGFYPVTAEIELQCRQQAGVEPSRWAGEVELHLYQNALQLWTVRW
jgi:hypothetical protein